MLNLDKLSYSGYGILMTGLLVAISCLFNLYPYSLIGLVTCTIQIPWYLLVRSGFKEPIHALGLNKCCVVTIIFFILLFICSKAMILMLDNGIAVIFTFILTALCCFATSTLPNVKEEKGKLFFGYKKHNESKYEKLIEYIKFNGLN